MTAALTRASRASFASICVLALAVALVAALPAPRADGQVPSVSAELVGPSGAGTGSVTVVAVAGGGVTIDVELDGLAPGFHAFHLIDGLAAGTCGAAPSDPSLVPGGYQLPVVHVNADGSARQQFSTDAFDVGDVEGHHVLIRTGTDNYANIPARYSSSAPGAPPSGPDALTLATGDAGPWIACGQLAPGGAVGALPSGDDAFTATLIAPDGSPAGLVTFTDVAGGVLVEADLHGLGAGIHGFHIHQNPTCTGVDGRPDFNAAGGHWNPGGSPHGDHAGDMPVLVATADGEAAMAFVLDRFDLASVRQHAVMVHAGRDNYAHIPLRYQSTDATAPGPDSATLSAGDAGARAACGLVPTFAFTALQLDALVAAGDITAGLEAKVRHALAMAEAWLALPKKHGPALSHLDRAIHLLRWQANVIEVYDKPNQGDPQALRALADAIEALRAVY